jgi:hypothetical protein
MIRLCTVCLVGSELFALARSAIRTSIVLRGSQGPASQLYALRGSRVHTTGNARIFIISPTRLLQPGNSHRAKECDALPAGLSQHAETPPLTTAVAHEGSKRNPGERNTIGAPPPPGRNPQYGEKHNACRANRQEGIANALIHNRPSFSDVTAPRATRAVSIRASRPTRKC